MPKTSPAALLKKLNSFPWDDWNKSLGKKLEQPYRDLVITRGTQAAKALGGTFNDKDPMLSKFMTNYVMERATQLDETTKAEVSDMIRSIFAGGGDDLGKAVKEHLQSKFDGYEAWRADRIARSESAIAYNHASVFGYHQAGVDEVDVLDGNGDDICAEADGQTWTLREALTDPIGHANCVRGLSPVVPDGNARRAVERLSLDDDLAFVCAIAAELIMAREDPCRERILEDISEDKD